MAIILDAGPLYALLDRSDRFHKKVVAFLKRTTEILVVPAIVLPEVSHFVLKYLDEASEQALLKSLLAEEMHLELHVQDDFARALEILEQYAGSKFGLADATVMACAERLNIRRVATLDRRHFSAFRPRHCAALELWP